MRPRPLDALYAHRYPQRPCPAHEAPIIAHELISPDEKQAWYEHIEHLAMLYAQILRETERESPRAVYLSADAHEGLARCRLLMASPIFA
jgi:hypothetical protein